MKELNFISNIIVSIVSPFILVGDFPDYFKWIVGIGVVTKSIVYSYKRYAEDND